MPELLGDRRRKTIQIYKGREPYPVPADVQERLMAALERKIAAKRGCR